MRPYYEDTARGLTLYCEAAARRLDALAPTLFDAEGESRD